MSLFSETLKELIKASSMSVYQLAKLSCVDRTTIQKSLTGDRIPNQEAVLKLRKALRLSPEEETRFLDHYEKTKMGESLYEQRNNTLQFFNTIAETYQIVDEIKALPVKTLEFFEKNHEPVESYNGEIQVQKLVQTIMEEVVFQEEKKELLIFLPFEFQFFYDLLKQYYLEEQNSFEIVNVFSISKEIDGLGKNGDSMAALETILPFLMTKRTGYHPYFYYDNHNPSLDMALIFPYYLITEKAVVVIAADFEKAILYRDETVIAVYREAFSELKKRCRLLTNKCSEMISYAGELAIINKRTAFFEPLPCLESFCIKEQIENLVKADCQHRDTAVEILELFYRQYAQAPLKRRCYFSVESLRNLVKTGELINFPAPIIRPLSPPEIIAYLQVVLGELESDQREIYGIRESVLKHEGAFEINQIDTSDILIRFYHQEKALLNSILIDERNISRMIIDFFEFLPESKWVYTNKELKNIIENLISSLQIISSEAVFL